MYELEVYDEHLNYGLQVIPAWSNFCNYLRKNNIIALHNMELELNKFNATVLNAESRCIGFETEEDATAFILRWS